MFTEACQCQPAAEKNVPEQQAVRPSIGVKTFFSPLSSQTARSLLAANKHALAGAASHYNAADGGLNEEEPVQRLFIGERREPGTTQSGVAEGEEVWRKLAAAHNHCFPCFSLSLSVSLSE